MSTAKRCICAWPRCGKTVLPSEFISTVGEQSGPKVYACADHRPKVELTKAIVGASVITGFQVGMDRAFPGAREKIYQIGSLVMQLKNGSKTEPAE